MSIQTKNIGRVLLLLVVMLMTACASSDSDEGAVVSPETSDCYLDIYVYAPDRPIVTRADVGPIAASDNESTVHSLKIWVFTHTGGKLVGYLPNADPTFLNQTGNQKYQMKLDPSFATAPEAVDVYVVANAETYVRTLDNEAQEQTLILNENTTRAALDAAVIGTGYFGTTTLTSSVPAEDGLPMSAIATNQPIYGSYPTLGIGKSEYEMTTLQLTRAVSKLRFVLCRKKGEQDSNKKLESIDCIQIAGNQIPTQSNLMPNSHSYSDYESTAITYFDASIDASKKLLPGAIPQVTDPMVYAYETQEAQVYEDLINHAADEEPSRKTANRQWLNKYGSDNNVEELKEGNLTEADLPQLKELGLTYLRESDKQLTGTISYTYNENSTEKSGTATFSMAAPGDFLRNHSWIVYIYYMDSKIYTLTVTHVGMKSWTTDNYEDKKNFYNW